MTTTALDHINHFKIQVAKALCILLLVAAALAGPALVFAALVWAF